MTDVRETDATVLLVEADIDERELFGAWLQGEGFRVLTCPGPTEPDYTCIGARNGACPLAAVASIVVLDMSTRSEGVAMGTASEDLLGLYLLAGARVVTFGSHPGEEIDGQLLRRRRHPQRQELVSAVSSLAEPETESQAPEPGKPAPVSARRDGSGRERP